MDNPTEYDAYGVITEAFFLHKNPRERYIIFPQLRLPWNPEDVSDARGTLPDFGLGCYFHIPPHVRLQGGAEVKRATPFMIDLPSCDAARAQAKAAVKGGHLPNEQLLWLMFIGPYFTILELGPFTQNQLITRTHKPNPSGEFWEAFKISVEKEAKPKTYTIHLLGTPDAATQLEYFMNTTRAFLPHVQSDHAM